MYILLWKLLATKFVADIYLDKIYGAPMEMMITDMSQLEEGRVGVQYYVTEPGWNQGPIVLKQRKCYYRKGILIWK